ncbi:MAG: Ig-like domain-containing protein, partial [Anaerolineae bacterium]
MNKRVSSLLMLILATSLGGLIVALTSLAMANGMTTASVLESTESLSRDLEPVIITGTALSAFAGVPVDQLFIYTHAEGTWGQIPFQVDERTATGSYTTTEDGLLDDNDEIVLMAMDLGDAASREEVLTSTLPISETWYEIAVTDPLSPTKRGWAYLFRSSLLTPTATSDYVDFDAAEHRIRGQGYSLGFGTTHPLFEYLALSGGDVDILDRNKIRLYSQIGLLPPQTEEFLGPFPDDLIKDGPVRVIVRGGNGRAYGSMVWWDLSIPQLPPGYRKALRFSTDFSESASGSILYNAVVTDGVTVDGINEAVPTIPLSPWWQLSTESGTLVLVGDSSSIGGDQVNYYLDDLAVDPEDTGDQRSYGDVGVYVEDPNLAFTYTFALYSLPGAQTNVGAVYEDYFEQPLSVGVSREGPSVMLEAVPERLTVGGSSTLTATVLDRHSDPISGTGVSFAIVSGLGTVTPTLAATDGAGRATASLSSEIAGSVAVKATAKSLDSHPKTVRFTPGPLTTVTLEALPERLIVGRSATLTAAVSDQYSNPIGGADVAFTIVSGQGSVAPSLATTDDTGQVTASLSSQVIGTVEVKATADSVDSDTQAVAFLEGTYVPLVLRGF